MSIFECIFFKSGLNQQKLNFLYFVLARRGKTNQESLLNFVRAFTFPRSARKNPLPFSSCFIPFLWVWREEGTSINARALTLLASMFYMLACAYTTTHTSHLQMIRGKKGERFNLYRIRSYERFQSATEGIGESVLICPELAVGCRSITFFTRPPNRLEQ